MAYTYKKYAESEEVKKAQEALARQERAKPAAYQSQWQRQLESTLEQILNRKTFQYDMNADALYNQYRDQYIRQGKLAMEDTMGVSAALTGGYGSSYAQQVGQQTYQGYLASLNDKLPELYRLALSKYQQEGEDLLGRYDLLSKQESTDYGRFQDAYTAWQTGTTPSGKRIMTGTPGTGPLILTSGRTRPSGRVLRRKPSLPWVSGPVTSSCSRRIWHRSM